MSRLHRGQQALIARQRAGAATGATVTYTRKSPAATVDLTGKAWTGRTVFRRNPGDLGAGAIVFGDRDYLIPYADLGFEPDRGDKITETVNGVVKTFEVIAPVGEPAWRWSDSGETLLRVHTKQKG